MQAKSPKLLFVVNIPRFFVSHRLPLALAAREAGFDVQVAASAADATSVAQITGLGLPFHPLPLSQHGINPLRELQTLLALIRLYRSLRPNLIHHVSIKPVLYGGIAARLTGQGAVLHAMSGLGYVFAGDALKAKLLARLSQPVFRLALGGRSGRIVFQNPDDRQLFVDRGMIKGEKALVIRGSGVDPDVFTARPEPATDKPVVLFAGRLLWQKGIGDFIEVARRLRGRARFLVVGYQESTSPQSVPAAQLRAWQAEKLIEWLGKRDDMPDIYARSHIVCLPSTYGEGVPKVLIEAAACGRACVTTDTPGCREIVRHADNGFLVPPNDRDALAQSVERLIDNPGLRQEMGARGREIVLAGFTLRQVAERTIGLYRHMLDASSPD